MSGYIDIHELAAALTERLEELVDALGLTLTINRKESRRGELRIGKRGSFSIETRGRKRGCWFSHESTSGGGPIQLIMHVMGYSFRDAIRWAADWLGLSQASDADKDRWRRGAAERARKQRIEERDEGERDTGWVVRKIIAGCRGLAGSLGERYFREHRCITGPLPPEPMFNPAVLLSKDDRREFPAVVIPARDESGTVRRLQVIYLDPRTGNKADIKTKKRTFGQGAAHVPAILNAAVTTGPLLTCEGPEDACSLASDTGCRVACSLGGAMKRLALKDQDVIIVGDNGAAGRNEIARPAGRAFIDQGCKVRWVFPPPELKDANDLLKRDGAGALRKLLERAEPWRAHDLPAYYPPPEEERHAALDRLQSEIAGIAVAAGRRGAVRGAAYKRRDIEIAGMDPAEVTPTVKGKITRRALKEVLAEHGLKRLPPIDRALITGSQGTGKTRAALLATTTIPRGAVIWVTQTTLRKCMEALADYAAAAKPGSLPAMVVRGRGADDPDKDGEKMCPRHEVANAAARRGVKVPEQICKDCPLRNECGYLKQQAKIKAMTEGGVFLMPREYLFVHSPAPSPDLLIADESITLAAIEDRLDAPPSILKNPSLLENVTPDAVDRTARTLHAIAAAFKEAAAGRQRAEEARKRSDAEAKAARRLGKKPPVVRLEDLQYVGPLALLRAKGETLDSLRYARRVIDEAYEPPQLKVNGGMSDAEIRRLLAVAKEDVTGRALIILGAIIKEAETDRAEFNAITYDALGLSVFRLKELRGVTKQTAVLSLDGTGSLLPNQKLFGPMRHLRIAVERDAEVIGTTGRSYSRQSILGVDRHGKELASANSKVPEYRKQQAERVRKEIAELVASRSGKTLLVATKRVAECFDAEKLLPGSSSAAWFALLRGLNQWEDHENAVVVGREQVSIAAIEDMARAYMADDPTPFVSMAKAPEQDDGPQEIWPYLATRGRRMRDGSVVQQVVPVHPDPRVQAVMEEMREAEIVQGADRVRPVFNRRSIYLLNNLVCDVTYDDIRTHAELVGARKRRQAEPPIAAKPDQAAAVARRTG